MLWQGVYLWFNRGRVDWVVMADERGGKSGWTAAERTALRKLIRMALVLLLAIAVAGTIAALLSSALGPL